MTQLYTVASQDGGEREDNLTLAEAAHRILTDDGREYQLRPNKDGDGFDLWTRQQVASIGWNRTHFFSLEAKEADAEAEIFSRVVEESSGPYWRGLIATPQTKTPLTK